MTKPRKIELNLGNPKNGWLPIELKSTDFELKFNASNIPKNPTDKLCESLILAMNGIETEICWNLEPECYFFELKQSGKNINLNISNSSGITKNRNPIYEMTGDIESVILPMYRSLKKFSTQEFDNADWKKIDQIKLNKLTELVASRKNENTNYR
ncbi:hypothetical protein KLA_16080 [Cellulophaga geojensis KL-A]|uniref:Uncharacterized protein n=1 Tax=Cellulophaga geojensis KL-A TaxID=1328323 RepID=A0ABP3B2X5_9FLAO|nr:hypothetical protein [Cellulophaga geojensis]EWH10943.1 hypothetical protein KLA_16080 [Cellulophaga geojensis KL-A]